MDFVGRKWFKFRSDFNHFELGLLNSREYGLLFYNVVFRYFLPCLKPYFTELIG